MTAVNCLLGPDAAYIATDGASYLLNGVRLGGGQKISIMGHLPCVIALSGSAALVNMLQAAINFNYTSFDEVVPEISYISQRIKDQFEREARKKGIGHAISKRASILFAGWSTSRNRIEAYNVSSYSDEVLTKEYPFKPWDVCPLHELEADFYSPPLPDVDQRVAALAEEYRKIETELEMPEYVLLALMEMQRSLPHRTERGEEVSIVGGFCQYTVLTREGITTKILKRWPDQVAA